MSSSGHKPCFPTKKPPQGQREEVGEQRHVAAITMLEEALVLRTLGMGGCPQQRERCNAGGAGSGVDPSQEQPSPSLSQSPLKRGDTQAETTPEHGIRGMPRAGLPPVCLTPLDFGAGILSACTDGAWQNRLRSRPARAVPHEPDRDV